MATQNLRRRSNRIQPPTTIRHRRQQHPPRQLAVLPRTRHLVPPTPPTPPHPFAPTLHRAARTPKFATPHSTHHHPQKRPRTRPPTKHRARQPLPRRHKQTHRHQSVLRTHRHRTLEHHRQHAARRSRRRLAAHPHAPRRHIPDL